MFPQQESSSLNSVTTTITSTPGEWTRHECNGRGSHFQSKDDTNVMYVVGTIAQANTTTSSAEPAATLAPGTLIDVGPYSCTRSTNLGLLLDVISSNLYTTQTNVNATLKYLIFNLHEATAAGSASVNLTDARLPQGDAHLGAIFNSPTANLSSFLYTPADLASQREDLNASFSWFGVNPSREPLPGYFDTEQRRGNAMTPNGWPAESFVELTQAKRLLVGLGTVDAELKGYNHSADAGAIFGPGYLEAITSVDITRNGVITDGCFFGPQDTAVSSANNSWAFVDLNQNRIASLSLGSQLAARLTRCGITPLLNSTLGGVTADKDWRPYEGFIQNTIWSWAEGQPWNSTDPNAEDPGLSNRCAVLNGASGRWQTENCGASHHSACRSPGQPYIWSIGRVDATYDEAGFSCKDESQFDAPRTALENRYLLQAWRNAINDRNLQDDKLLWVNFNDLDAKACWVIGQNATCPYLQDMNRERIVIVPTVAGIVVFVLAALTVFIKCASNRQNTKRRRKRMDDGWEYEGVPS